MQDLAPTGLSGCSQTSKDISQHNIERKQHIFMKMAGGGGASTLGWKRDNEDPWSEDFTQLYHRLSYLLTN